MDLQKEAAIWEQPLDDATEKGRQEGKQEGRQEGILIGHEKARKAEKIEVAKKLLKAGVSIDLIPESTGLPQAEIAQLKEEMLQ